MLRLVNILLFSIIVIVGGSILYKVGEYITDLTSTSFYKTRQEGFDSQLYVIAFYIHCVFGSVALFSGIPQFFKKLRGNLKRHIILGQIYVISVLIAAVCGVVMNYFSPTDFKTKILFYSLAIAWTYFTLVAYKKAKSKDYKQHNIYMTRSYILTASAVFLRLYSFLVFVMIGVKTADTYFWVAFCSWVPHLFVYELLLLIQNFKSFK